MDIESITLSLAKKCHGAVAIHAEINNFRREGTVGCSTVTRSLWKRSFADYSEAPPEKSEIEESDPVDNTILQALDE
jgi:hypothetical protein